MSLKRRTYGLPAMRLYRELTPWYRLVDPAADHAEEAAVYAAALERAASPPPQTLLELGAGAGHNALHLKHRFRCTLSDLSPEMQALGKFFRQEGLYTFVRWNTFFTNPPLCINEAELREAFAIIDKGLEITDKAVST